MNRKRIVSLVLISTVVAGMFGGRAIYLAARAGSRARAAVAADHRTEEERVAVAARAYAGDPEAQLQMGVWGLASAARREQYAQAAEWLRKAAESGNAEAEYRLGTVYQAGRGVPQDNTNAVLWFQQAAAQQHAAALYNLGSMYELGRGVAPDSRAAARLIQQAAELGDAYAQYSMARRCEEGHGVTRDLVDALKWYELSEAGGIGGARDGKRALESQLTADERRRAEQAVEDLKKRARSKALAKND